MSIHWTLIAGFLYAEIGKNATTKTRQEPGTCETEIQMTSYRHNSAPPGSFYIHKDVEQGELNIYVFWVRDLSPLLIYSVVSFLSSSFPFPGVQVEVPPRPGVPADLLFLCAGEFILIGT